MLVLSAASRVGMKIILSGMARWYEMQSEDDNTTSVCKEDGEYRYEVASSL